MKTLAKSNLTLPTMKMIATVVIWFVWLEAMKTFAAVVILCSLLDVSIRLTFSAWTLSPFTGIAVPTGCTLFVCQRILARRICGSIFGPCLSFENADSAVDMFFVKKEPNKLKNTSLTSFVVMHFDHKSAFKFGLAIDGQQTNHSRFVQHAELFQTGVCLLPQADPFAPSRKVRSV